MTWPVWAKSKPSLLWLKRTSQALPQRYSKPVDANEVPDIVGDNGVGAASDRQFKNEFVARVRQERPQAEVDIGLAAIETEGADDSLDGRLRNVQDSRLTLPDSLIFENQGVRRSKAPTPVQVCGGSQRTLRDGIEGPRRPRSYRGR
jgi:hypothetical protein